MSNLKQVIVMRSDLRNTDGHKIRTGKLIAQGAHASMAAILPYVQGWDGSGMASEYMARAAKVNEWLAGSFTKVCVKVDSEQELIDVYNAAEIAGLIAAPIRDNGLTEFGGVPTKTCCAIGPDTPENLAPITGHLRLM